MLEVRKSNDFEPISDALKQEMRSLLGESWFTTDEATLSEYGHDETEDFLFLPEAVAFPPDTATVSALMRLCNLHRIPVTIRGGGSGLAGGALPIHGGLLISMKRFDRIINIDERNFQVVVEPGVITETLQNTLQEKGLY